MIDFKIKKITSLFLKRISKKLIKQNKQSDLDLESIFNELIEEINTNLKKKFIKIVIATSCLIEEGYTQRTSINNHKVYLRTGEYGWIFG